MLKHIFLFKGFWCLAVQNIPEQMKTKSKLIQKIKKLK